MATTLHQARPASPAKYDAAVEEYLARARRRIRALDALVGLLVLGSGTLAFLLIMVLCDRALVLSPLTRQLALAGFGLGALLYAVFGIALPLGRRINPYFAARHLEQVVPGAKNSVVNWLDLHGEPLPPAIHAAVGQRAARDLASADLDQAISGRRAAWLGGLTGALAFAAFVTMALLGARPFYSLLGRTFAPFREGAIATRTSLTLVQPEGGNVTVPVGRAVRFAVEVDGRVPDPGRPDAIRLLFHYQPGDPDEERPLERESGDRWVTTLPGFQVQNGFWYRVAGGDTETPEYRVQVRATPLVTEVDATYHYRPYLGWRDDTTHDPNLRALRGTGVRLVAHTNRTVRVADSRLEIEVPQAAPAAPPAGANRLPAAEVRIPDAARKLIPAEPVPGDPQALAFRLVLDESGKYRIWFTSVEGEANTDPVAYSIQALPDHAPQVDLTKPGQDVTLPANGMLALEGLATDDIGLTALTLRLRQADGAELRPQPYREGKSFKLDDGGYPKSLEYRDLVRLDQLKDAAGNAVTLQPKAVLEYWLEATDNCDYPRPNLGKSQTFKVTIGEPDADKKRQEQERQKAEQEQKKHEAKQDEQLKKECQEGRPDANPDHAPQDRPEQAKPDGNKPDDKAGGKPQDKDGPGEKSRQQQNAGQKSGEREKPGDKTGDAAKPGDKPKQGNQAGAQANKEPGKEGAAKEGTGQQGPQDPRQQQAERLAKAAEQERQQRGEGKGEPGKEPKAEPNNGNANAAKPGAGQNGNKQPNGQGKEGGPPQAQPEKQPQQGGGQGERQPQAGDKNHQGASGAKSEPQAGAQGERKEGNPAGANQQAKPGEKQGAQEPANGNNSGGAKNNAGQRPDGGAEQGGQPKESAQQKPASEATPQDVQRMAEQARQGDAQQQAAAEKQLEKAAEQAKDPAAREAAEKALKQLAQEKKESEPGSAKSEPKESGSKKEGGGACQCKGGGSGGEKAGQSKGSGSGQGGGKGDAKGGGGQKAAQGNAGRPGQGHEQQGKGDKGEAGQPGQGSGQQGRGETGDANQPGSAKGKPGDSGKAAATGTGGGQTPGAALAGRREGTTNATEGTPPEDQPAPGNQPAPNRPKRPGELVLEDLRKTIEELKKHPEELKKVLDRAGLQEKDVREVEDYLNEKLPPPQQGGPLSNLNARQAAKAKGGTSDAKAATPAGPPPGFRNSTRDFTRRLAEPNKD